MYVVILYNVLLPVSCVLTILFFVVPLGGEVHIKELEEDLENVGGESPPINTGHYDHLTRYGHVIDLSL